jgi:hypothetical protein
MNTSTTHPHHAFVKGRGILFVIALVSLVWALGAPATAMAAITRISVWPDSDRITGDGWTVSSPMKITIDNPATTPNPDYTWGVTSSAMGQFDVTTPAFDIKRGYTVKVVGLPATKTMVVGDLTVTRVDPTTEVFRGTAGPGESVGIHEYDSDTQESATADINGQWLLTYGSANIKTTTTGFAWTTVDGNRTMVDWPCMAGIYRFYNYKKGVHFYTADVSERNNVIANLASAYGYEGVGYTLNTTNKYNNDPLYRFYNLKKGVHFYTADEAEKNRVVATLASTYRLEGEAYRISTTAIAGARPVYRFFNRKTGVHFYTADEAEKANVIDHLSSRYNYEGIGYYLAQ